MAGHWRGIRVVSHRKRARHRRRARRPRSPRGHTRRSTLAATRCSAAAIRRSSGWTRPTARTRAPDGSGILRGPRRATAWTGRTATLVGKHAPLWRTVRRHRYRHRGTPESAGAWWRPDPTWIVPVLIGITFASEQFAWHIHLGWTPAHAVFTGEAIIEVLVASLLLWWRRRRIAQASTVSPPS